MFFNVYLFLRQRDTEHEWGRGRKRGRQNLKQTRLRAVSTEPDMGLELMNHEIMTWAKVGCLTDWAIQAPLIIIILKFFLMFIYFWDRERQSASGRGAERGRHRIPSRLQAPSCQHRAWCRAWTHEPWDHDLSWSQTLNRLSHLGTPVILFISVLTNCLAVISSWKWRRNLPFHHFG